MYQLETLLAVWEDEAGKGSSLFTDEALCVPPDVTLDYCPPTSRPWNFPLRRRPDSINEPGPTPVLRYPLPQEWQVPLASTMLAYGGLLTKTSSNWRTCRPRLFSPKKHAARSSPLPANGAQCGSVVLLPIPGTATGGLISRCSDGPQTILMTYLRNCFGIKRKTLVNGYRWKRWKSFCRKPDKLRLSLKPSSGFRTGIQWLRVCGGLWGFMKPKLWLSQRHREMSSSGRFALC